MKKTNEQQTSELSEILNNLGDFHQQIHAIGEALLKAFGSDAHVYTIGNGGSSLQAQHLAEELSGKYKAKRRPLPCMALSADSSVITCIGNDFGFEKIFSRQLEAFGKQGDVLIAFSTSGNSKNILEAVNTAHEKGMTVIGLTIKDAGLLREKSDITLEVPTNNTEPPPTERIQELHLHAIHLICEYLENI